MPILSRGYSPAQKDQIRSRTEAVSGAGTVAGAILAIGGATILLDGPAFEIAGVIIMGGSYAVPTAVDTWLAFIDELVITDEPAPGGGGEDPNDNDDNYRSTHERRQRDIRNLGVRTLFSPLSVPTTAIDGASLHAFLAAKALVDDARYMYAISEQLRMNRDGIEGGPPDRYLLRAGRASIAKVSASQQVCAAAIEHWGNAIREYLPEATIPSRDASSAEECQSRRAEGSLGQQDHDELIALGLDDFEKQILIKERSLVEISPHDELPLWQGVQSLADAMASFDLRRTPFVPPWMQ